MDALKAVLVGLANFFGMVLVLALMFSGFVMMISPERGRGALKRSMITAALFLLGLAIVRLGLRG